MEMNQSHLRSALPLAILNANQKFEQKPQQSEPAPLVNLKRAIFDACKVGDPFDSNEMIEALEKFGYKPNSILASLQTLTSEKKLSRSLKAPYAYTKLRSWDTEADTPLRIRESKVKAVNVDHLPRIPPITAMKDAMSCMLRPVKVATTFSLHDLDLVVHQLTGMKATAERYFHTRLQFHPDDATLAHNYGALATDLQVLITNMHQTRATLLQIAQMASTLRTMT